MRLSGWRETAPAAESMSGEVLAALVPVLSDLGAEADPVCWVAWGDDPQLRYSILVPTMAGLIVAAVRTAGPEGIPRASAKLVRWSKLSMSELAIESTGGHRIVAIQVETLVLKGVDDEADRICEFARGLIAEVEDRHPAPVHLIAQVAAAAGSETPVRLPVVAAPEVGTAARSGTEAPDPAAAPDPPAAPGGAAAPGPVAAPPKLEPAPMREPAYIGQGPRPEPAPGPTVMAEPRTIGPAVPLPAPVLLPAPIPRQSASPPEQLPAPEPTPPAGARQKPARSARQAAEAVPEPPAESTPAAEAEPDRSQWVPPHPIDESPRRKPHRSRPWRP